MAKGQLNASVTQVFNFNRTSNQFVFRSNAVRNGRRVGVLYKGYRAWVGNNSFTGMGGGALELWNAPFEGLCARTVLFRGNTVTDVCQLDRTAAPIWTIGFDVPPGGSPCHHDLLVADNSFDTGPGPALLLSDVDATAVVGNAFTLCVDSPWPANVSANSEAGYLFGSTNQVHPDNATRLCSK